MMVDTADNKIGDRGVLFIFRGNWKQLRQIELSNEYTIKRVVRLARRGAGDCRRLIILRLIWFYVYLC